MKTLLALSFLVLAVPAFAESGPCKEDMERLCKGVEHGGGAVKKCMKEHEAELSEGCRAMIGKMKEKAAEKKDAAEEACKADKEKFCKDVEPGEGRIMKCLKEHDAELSESCKAMSGKIKEKHEKMKAMKEKGEACKADKEKFCKDVKPGEGRIVECLKAHEAELSEGCRKTKGEKHEKKEKPAGKEKAPESKQG
ncbi:hypothetical protein EPO15_01060 [bacterium]|nr:MAG: hypothetical protein EPO15_01060 [bacterium]